ncbi:RNA polymerase sigma factor [Desertimonas flava]|uniref:RNA polymerase sigma factor n=1 Tax=Desertimonas flava TaxID=2064846 RepID=UPI00196995EF|nr:sigma-70 family RNA polymerase sigma factor [Desertimonas flava]
MTDQMNVSALGDVWRREAAHVIGALLRTHHDLADCEDAAQEALVAAALQWPRDGSPDDPRAWLIRVARRRLVDQLRSESARSRRETADAVARRVDDPLAEPPDATSDNALQLMLRCCHPSLSRPSQVALTLRCVAGLTTDEIAMAYLVPSATMGQRLSRARSTLRGEPFAPPTPDELPERVAAVLDVCHLVFNEGHTRTAGAELVGVGLAQEAIRLTRMLHVALPDHAEAAGLLALMLLTHARAAARTDAAGDLVPLAEQDRFLWDRAAIDEGVALLERTLGGGHVGRYQLQASIAAVHADAASAEATDWLQISVLYGMLQRVAPSPAVELNRAVAVGMALGPDQGVAIVRRLLDEHPAMADHHRTHAVLAHLLEREGDLDAARHHYEQASRLTANLPEQRYLNRRLAQLHSGPAV